LSKTARPRLTHPNNMPLPDSGQAHRPALLRHAVCGGRDPSRSPLPPIPALPHVGWTGRMTILPPWLKCGLVRASRRASS
jgi:hypothetical protein